MLVEAQQTHQRPAWNTGRIIGPKPALKPRHIWAIRTRLQHERRVRDLAMFKLAIDSKLPAIWSGLPPRSTSLRGQRYTGFRMTEPGRLLRRRRELSSVPALLWGLVVARPRSPAGRVRLGGIAVTAALAPPPAP